ncbi:hypothetical protein Syn7502_00213 [Synechococcus sp. PCC 7502]|nr:hypothetical protein Syn7502_00213 [Synechococcus sp. PCC 7502]
MPDRRPTLLWTILVRYISKFLSVFLSGSKLAWTLGLVWTVSGLGIYFGLKNLELVLIPILSITFLLIILRWVITSSWFLNAVHAQLMDFPSIPAIPSDAIVILGRGEALRQSRVEVAVNLWRSLMVPIIFASGTDDALEIQAMLRELGIPDQVITGEDRSRTTAENAEFTSLILGKQGIKRILLVTDPLHMKRSLLTFQHYGFDVIPVPTAGNDGLSKQEQDLLIIREYFALVSYGLLGRLA